MIAIARLLVLSIGFSALLGCSSLSSNSTSSSENLDKKKIDDEKEARIQCQRSTRSTKIIKYKFEHHRRNAGYSGLSIATEPYRQAVAKYYLRTGTLPEEFIDLGYSPDHLTSYNKERMCGLKFDKGIIKAAGTKNMGVGATFIWEPKISDENDSISWSCRTNVKLVNQDGLCPFDDSLSFE